VNYAWKRAIVSSITVVTFISIPRSRDRPMAEGEGKQEPPEEEGNRKVENAVMLGFSRCWWWPGSGCSAPWPMYGRCRIAPHRGDVTVERSKFQRDS